MSINLLKYCIENIFNLFPLLFSFLYVDLIISPENLNKVNFCVISNIQINFPVCVGLLVMALLHVLQSSGNFENIIITDMSALNPLILKTLKHFPYVNLHFIYRKHKTEP